MNISLAIYNFILFFAIVIFYPVLSFYLKTNISKKYPIWVHCASLGEVKIALRLVNALMNKLNLKNSDILITTTTISAKNFAINFHKEVAILPLDFYFFVKKITTKVQPRVFILIETEIWPNYINVIKKFGSKIFILNGRVSKKTFIFLKMFNFMFKNLLNKVDLILVREKIDYIRFKNIGIAEEKIKITGNMKYDDLDSFEINVKKEDFSFNSEDFVITFGSIREGEEKEIIKFIKKFKEENNLKFILAPRHLNLVKKICKILNKQKISYKLRTNSDRLNFKCLVVNTHGELKKFYKISDLVFVCGSILPYGGQNFLEAASLGKTVVLGPYVFNFLEPAKLFLSNQAVIQVSNLVEFYSVVKDALNFPQKYLKIGLRAKELIQKLKGVTEKNIQLIEPYLISSLYEKNFNN
ncbi:MAG: glycosyltransferase N-terminal domain-containing protein [Endomicrobiia bacterium]